MALLSVNVNKIALLRNARDTSEPCPLSFALEAIESGAKSITVHPRPDLRHITPDDTYKIKKNISVELNIEGNPLSLENNKYPGFLNLVKNVIPTQCTLVPDEEGQKTSDHGWDLKKNFSYLQEIVAELSELGIRVSIFLDASNKDWESLVKIKPQRVELFTGPFAYYFGTEKEPIYWQQLLDAAEKISELNIGLNAGHDLNLQHLPRIKKLKNLKEVSIGQALVVDSFKKGWKETIMAYLDCLEND